MTWSEEIQQARGIIQQVSDRAEQDAGYRNELSADPAGALLAAGLSAAAVAQVLRETGLDDDDVAAYLGSQVVFAPSLLRTTGHTGAGWPVDTCCISAGCTAASIFQGPPPPGDPTTGGRP